MRLPVESSVRLISTSRTATVRPRAMPRWLTASWSGGSLGSDDVTEARRQDLTPVTYDWRRIPSLIKTWAEEGRNYSGVILIDDNTIFLADIRGLVLALSRLYRTLGQERWTDRVCFLQR